MTIKIKCLVNGEISPAVRERVRRGLAGIHLQHFGVPADGVQVEFTEVARGMWFTGGKPSGASMVLGSVPAGTPQPLRVQVMDEVARLFSEATGTPYDDVMVVAADARQPG